MKILVVGGAGYLGSRIIKCLSTCSYETTVYDALLYQDEYFSNGIKFVYGDVLDPKSLEKALSGVDIVIWLAAIVGDSACQNSAGAAMGINTGSLHTLCQFYKGPIIFPSTASVYGKQEGEATEESPLNPLSIYAETKVDAEKILLKSSNKVLILRLGTLYGVSPRMRFDLAINTMTRDAVEKGIITVFGGEQRRPFLPISQAALWITAWATGGAKWEPGIYNLALGNFSIMEVAEKIAGIVPGTRVTLLKSDYENDKRDYAMSTEKVEKMGFKPDATWSMEGEIAEIASLVLNKNVKNPYSSRYVNTMVER